MYRFLYSRIEESAARLISGLLCNFLNFHTIFFFSKCLTCDLDICIHMYSGFFVCAHTYFFLIIVFFIFNTTFAFIIILVWVKSEVIFEDCICYLCINFLDISIFHNCIVTRMQALNTTFIWLCFDNSS